MCCSCVCVFLCCLPFSFFCCFLFSSVSVVCSFSLSCLIFMFFVCWFRFPLFCSSLLFSSFVLVFLFVSCVFVSLYVSFLLFNVLFPFCRLFIFLSLLLQKRNQQTNVEILRESLEIHGNHWNPEEIVEHPWKSLGNHCKSMGIIEIQRAPGAHSGRSTWSRPGQPWRQGPGMEEIPFNEPLEPLAVPAVREKSHQRRARKGLFASHKNISRQGHALRAFLDLNNCISRKSRARKSLFASQQMLAFLCYGALKVGKGILRGNSEEGGGASCSNNNHK